MKFDQALQCGTLIKRYKRFLADVQLEDGSEITIHCPNTGSMQGCAEPGSRVWFSRSDNDKRKYPHTWEMVQNQYGHMIGINTHRANSLVHEALANDLLDVAKGCEIKPEVKLSHGNSRIDFMLTSDQGDYYIEVKNVTLGSDNGQGYFPDAVTSRGSKHLQELIALREQGHGTMLLFCVQHDGIEQVSPADHIDAEYGENLRQADAAGVDIIALAATLSPQAITLAHEIPVKL